MAAPAFNYLPDLQTDDVSRPETVDAACQTESPGLVPVGRFAGRPARQGDRGALARRPIRNGRQTRPGQPTEIQLLRQRLSEALADNKHLREEVVALKRYDPVDSPVTMYPDGKESSESSDSSDNDDIDNDDTDDDLDRIVAALGPGPPMQIHPYELSYETLFRVPASVLVGRLATTDMALTLDVTQLAATPIISAALSDHAAAILSSSGAEVRRLPANVVGFTSIP